MVRMRNRDNKNKGNERYTSAKPSPSPPLEDRVGERRPFTLAALHRRTGCTQIMRKLENQTYLPPAWGQTRKEASPKTAVGKQIH
jgi:hypothetical protein